MTFLALASGGIVDGRMMSSDIAGCRTAWQCVLSHIIRSYVYHNRNKLCPPNDFIHNFKLNQTILICVDAKEERSPPENAVLLWVFNVEIIIGMMNTSRKAACDLQRPMLLDLLQV